MSVPPEKPVTFTGPLAAVLRGLVAEKQGAGYHYEAVAHDLRQFDRFCLTFGHAETTLPRNLVWGWTAKRPHETECNRRHRISIIRVLGDYMRRCGYPAYVYPRHMDARTPPAYIPHIFTRPELASLFSVIDACSPDRASPQRHLIFPLLFRLLYGCGLRISEALALRVADVDLATATVRIRAGKFDKERLVPLHPALADRFRTYVQNRAGASDQAALFPSPQGGPYSARTVYSYFRRFLHAAGIVHGGRGHGPRLHDLRHTFAVHCLQRWVAEGVDLTVALPYLSGYLGHTSIKGTQEYLRLTADVYPSLVATVTKHFGALVPGGTAR